MKWPWNRTETRADSSYSDALVQAIVSNASGKTTAYVTATAALEACSGFVGRAFSSAQIAGGTAAQMLDPVTMNMIGRSLIRRGEIVLLLLADMDGVQLLPCESHDVDGSPDPASWRYRCTVGGPERTLTYHVGAESVLHLTYARDPEKPWRGYGPLYSAQLAGRLSAQTAAALADESGSPHGTILTVPVDGQDPTVTTLRSDLASMKGQIHLLQGGDWDAADSGSKVGAGNLRLGANPPAALVELHKRATMEIFMACGLNAAVFELGAGVGGREAYRQALFGTIAPLGRQVETELRRKLDDDTIALGWDELRAADIAGRARAFQSMVTAGMDLAKAAALSGLMIDGNA